MASTKHPPEQDMKPRQLEQDFSKTESICSILDDEIPAHVVSQPPASPWKTALAAESEAASNTLNKLRHQLSVAGRFADNVSHKLICKPTAEVYALLAIPLVMWWLAVVAGMWVYQGLNKGQRVHHRLMWFDSGILRPAGAALPFVAILLRAAAHAVHHAAVHGAASIPAAFKVAAAQAAAGRRFRTKHQQQLKMGSLIMWCLLIYGAVTMLRAAVYFTHWALLYNRVVEYHVLSDHIFLAASVLSCLHVELLCLVSDMQYIVNPPQPARSAGKTTQQSEHGQLLLGLLAGVFAIALSMYVCITADMYYTAKYFHHPLESLGTALLVLRVFQLPMLSWVWQRIRNSDREVRNDKANAVLGLNI